MLPYPEILYVYWTQLHRFIIRSSIHLHQNLNNSWESYENINSPRHSCHLSEQCSYEIIAKSSNQEPVQPSYNKKSKCNHMESFHKMKLGNKGFSLYNKFDE